MPSAGKVEEAAKLERTAKGPIWRHVRDAWSRVGQDVHCFVAKSGFLERCQGTQWFALQKGSLFSLGFATAQIRIWGACLTTALYERMFTGLVWL